MTEESSDLTCDPDQAPIHETWTAACQLLRERFGHPEFRGLQEPAVRAVLEGRDVLITLPTGAGKSLVYQLPALVLEGLTLVVSPLIALMKDQVDALLARGIRAAYVNSSLSARERKERLEAAARGELDLLFVTPERFRSPLFLELLPRLDVTRLAVDEAHCISHWGHDFRPDYFKLGEYRNLIGNPPTVALTATATPRVAADIVTALRLENPVILRAGIERENLFFAATEMEIREELAPRVADRIASIDGAGIVYSTLIRDLEELHDELRRRGVHSLVYHGKLSNRERREMQERFMTSDREVVLATNAFGMGVDKPDIRFVLHAQMPRTLEAWAQEIGRAGRDGAASWCELFFHQEDIAIQQNFIEWANPSREYLFGVYETLCGWGERIQTRELDDLRDELLIKNRADNRVSIALKWLEVLGVTKGSFESHDLRIAAPLEQDALPGFVGTEDKRRTDLEALLGMWRFAKDEGTCRRVGLARHFETEEPSEPCGTCDVCTSVESGLRRLAPRKAATNPAAPKVAPETDAPAPRDEPPSTGKQPGNKPLFQRGDWVRVDGRHVGQVVKVEGDGSRVRLTVESASDLRRRTVDPKRGRVERLES